MYVSKLHELITYLEEFLTDTPGQEIESLSTDEVVDVIFHSMPTMRKNKIIEQDFNYAYTTVEEITDFLETKVENLKPREKKKKSSTAYK